MVGAESVGAVQISWHMVLRSAVWDYKRNVRSGSILRGSPGVLPTSEAGGRADEIGTKADVGLECRLLGVEQTCRQHGWNFSF